MLSYIRMPAGAKLVKLLAASRWLLKHDLVLFAKLINRYIESRFGVYIHLEAYIGDNVAFPHPVSIVIGAGVVVGDNCIIYQGVTLGGARIGDAADRNYPILGDNVTVYAGAQILGKVNLGSGSVVGANAVVIRDVLADSVVVGVPARVVKN